MSCDEMSKRGSLLCNLDCYDHLYGYDIMTFTEMFPKDIACVDAHRISDVQGGYFWTSMSVI